MVPTSDFQCHRANMGRDVSKKAKSVCVLQKTNCYCLIPGAGRFRSDRVGVEAGETDPGRDMERHIEE